MIADDAEVERVHRPRSAAARSLRAGAAAPVVEPRHQIAQMRRSRASPSPRSRRGAPRRGRGAAAPSAAAKPSFAASLSRASVWPTGRISPESPISPKTTVSAGTGVVGQRRDQRRRDGQIGGRLGDAQAAGDVEIDVVGADRHAAARLEHRQHHRQARCRPSRPPRGAACRAARAPPAPGSRPAPAACPRCRRTPRRRRRRSRRSAARAQEQRRRDSAPRRGPRSVISNTPISSVGPKRFLTARRMRN